MQLDRVEIEDFRGIDRLTVELDDLTTIIGEPDGGKSSLLRAIARVLGPRKIDQPPQFSTADFHRPGVDESDRADLLSITLGLRADADDPLVPDDDRLRNGLTDGGVSVHVVAQRRGEAEPVTSVTVIDRAGAAIDAIDGPGLLTELRRRHPAVIVGGPRPAISRTRPDDERGDSRLRSILLGAAEPRTPLTWDELVDVREDLLRTAGALADQLGPTPERRRSVREMTDTPRPLVTDLGSALEEDAGHQRRIAALWLLVAILDALPPEGIGVQAEPILLFDDIEANLHPTWLAALTSVALNLPFQQVVATHSPEVLAWVPLSSLRRLVRTDGAIEARSVQPASYSTEELRRVTYHLRLNRAGSFFARCWVLVEGETEAWLVPEFARIAGVEFPVEGIRVIEFAQSGLTPLVKIANDLGIGWLLLADGDVAGQNYARAARKHIEADGEGGVIVLPDRDIEHYLFRNGYADVIRKAAGRSRKRKASEVIRAAIERTSKPGLALVVLAAADGRGADGVPPVIRDLAETARNLARG
jgi:putative ATP-dependent endonuclease of OLD family